MKPPTINDSKALQAYLTRMLIETPMRRQKHKRFQHGLTCLINRIAKLDRITPNQARARLEKRVDMIISKGGDDG